MEGQTRKYDLEDRIRKFSEDIIDLCYSTRGSVISDPIIKQLVRSGTSVGANYCEAIETGSKKDFRHKLLIAKKEAKETFYWLTLFKRLKDSDAETISRLLQECKELILILSASIKKVS